MDKEQGPVVFEARENSIGIYAPDGFDAASERAIARETGLGRKIGILSFYEAWGNERRPDIAGMELCLKRGFVPMLTWEPWRLPAQQDPAPEDQPDFSLAALSGGRYDDYIRQWAVDLGRLSSPVFLRPMHEMNGDWYPWCGKVNGNTPEHYTEAWCSLRSIFREAGSDRVIWVWSPYCASVPDVPENELSRYFPGEDEVDWLAMDGYNWGTTREWSRWQGFDEIFADGYVRLSGLAGGKPLMIAEVGCAEEGGDKGAWIRDASDAMKSRFSAVRGLVWFDVNKECDWRIESSPGSFTAFKTHFQAW